MKSDKVFDIVIWLLIVAAGLGAAYVCFGVLKSTAQGQFQSYSVGGAIAGALVSWGVLTSVYLQLRGSSNELRELRNRTEELQNKVIRGAPRPLGFEIEVDERQRIVLARPKEWRPKGGTIFFLEQRDAAQADEQKSDKPKSGDVFPASFLCYFEPIIRGRQGFQRS